MVQPRSTAAGRPSRKQLVVIACLIALGVVAGAFILRGGAASRPGEGAEGHAEHSETAKSEGKDDGHGHGEEGAGHAEEVPKGPNGGQRFTEGDFGLELLLVEEGGVPRYKAWVYNKDKPAPLEGNAVTLSLTRPNGETQEINLTPKGGVLTSDQGVPEPHVFEATVAVQTPTESYLFTFAEMEGKVEMTEAQIQAASISLETSRPASIRSALQFPGEIRFNEDRTAHIVPRVGGVVDSVSANLGQKVKRGQVLAVVSSAMVSELRSELRGSQQRQALARTVGVKPEQLIVANGSNELLEFIGHVFLEPGDAVVVADRAFAIYRLIAAMFQAQVAEAPMRNYTHDLDAMLRAVTPRTKVIFIANPNNPTGTMVANADLDRFMENLPPHVVVCLDEAYIDLLPPERRPDSLRYIREGRRVILLRTFAKSHGLAGLRIGYAVTREHGVLMMNQIRQPFNVNSLALAAALAALDDDEHLRRFQELVRTELPFMMAGLDRLGLTYVPSVANFLMVDVGDGRAVFKAMQKELVIVRPLNGYNLPRHVRISLGTRPENEKCLRALEKVLAQRSA